jgi:hypothetical protein
MSIEASIKISTRNTWPPAAKMAEANGLSNPQKISVKILPGISNAGLKWDNAVDEGLSATFPRGQLLTGWFLFWFAWPLGATSKCDVMERRGGSIFSYPCLQRLRQSPSLSV